MTSSEWEVVIVILAVTMTSEWEVVIVILAVNITRIESDCRLALLVPTRVVHNEHVLIMT